MERTDVARPLPTLRGPRVALRPGSADDEPALREVFAAPEVARWWPMPTDDEIRDQLLNRDPEVEVWMVEVDGRVAGLIQAYEEADSLYRHAGIDIVLHPRVHGRGLGPEAIRVLARHLVEDRGHHRIVIDPNAANTRAIRAYERVGFRRVGVMREYEWSAHENRWTDGVLMELLRDELLDDQATSRG
jgi:aminoglycoside 6'-N-acetyltransferase